MTVKVGERYRFEGVVEEVHEREDGSAAVRFNGGDDGPPTWMSAAELAAATLIEKPYEPAVGDVVTWGDHTSAARVLWADARDVLVESEDGYRTLWPWSRHDFRRLPPETPLGPIAASQEGER